MKDDPKEYIIVGLSYDSSKSVYYNKNKGFRIYRGKDAFTLNTNPKSASRMTKLEAEEILERILTRDHRPEDRDLLYHIGVHKIKEEEPIETDPKDYLVYVSIQKRDTESNLFRDHLSGYLSGIGSNFKIDKDPEIATRYTLKEANEFVLESKKILSHFQGKHRLKYITVTDIYSAIRNRKEKEPMKNEQGSSYSVMDKFDTVISNHTNDIKLVEAFAKLQSMETEDSNPRLLYVIRDGRFIESIYQNGIKFVPEE